MLIIILLLSLLLGCAGFYVGVILSNFTVGLLLMLTLPAVIISGYFVKKYPIDDDSDYQ